MRGEVLEGAAGRTWRDRPAHASSAPAANPTGAPLSFAAFLGAGLGFLDALRHRPALSPFQFHQTRREGRVALGWTDARRRPATPASPAAAQAPQEVAMMEDRSASPRRPRANRAGQL